MNLFGSSTLLLCSLTSTLTRLHFSSSTALPDTAEAIATDSILATPVTVAVDKSSSSLLRIGNRVEGRFYTPSSVTMEGLPFTDTFGVMLIGSFIAMGVYGITTLQTYFYFLYYPKDGTSIKWLVGMTWALDTLHVTLMCHAVHHYLIRGFTETAVLRNGVWSLYVSSQFDLESLTECF